MKRITKIITMGVLIIMSIGLFAGCKNDYGYEYHFSVIGENGTISYRRWDATKYEWQYYETSPLEMRGGKEGSHNLEFIAAPSEGFQVKEWRYNDEIVEGNTSNSFTTGVVNYKNPKITITVEFEPIPSEN
jgi:hypothetical protein